MTTAGELNIDDMDTVFRVEADGSTVIGPLKRLAHEGYTKKTSMSLGKVHFTVPSDQPVEKVGL